MTVWVRVAAIAAVLMAAGCGGGEGDFAPPCPGASILSDAGDLQRFNGSGRDFLDTTLQARVIRLDGTCKRDGAGVVATTISAGLELNRGPAARGRQTTIPYFIAVSRGGTVLDKQVYNLPVQFPENTDHLTVTTDTVSLRIPVSDKVKADAYQVLVGFQLTPDELAWNRQRRPSPPGQH